ncbi:MAG TPA: HEAT repeat domain-containing protein [Gemmatimonadaceae bacterium]|nr:HEAT repeat domain-containing protein [Gemmatimonadaceae bacterium]
MNSTIFSTLGTLGGGLTGSSVSMLLLLAKATLILLVALGITLTMQRASAGARHLVWLVTLAALLLVPGLTAWAPIPIRVLPPASKSVSDAKSPSNAASTLTAGNTASAAEKNEKPGVNAPGGSTIDASPAGVIGGKIAASPVLSVLSIIFLVWAAVLLVIAASLGYATLMVHRIVNRARPLDSADWLSPLFEVSDRLALEEPPRLLRSEDAKMPFACGVFRATIVLPAECDSWSLDRRRAVLLHELAHVRRHDLIGHTLSRLACAVYWFHPLVWKAAKQLRSESERACDDLALACGARAADYAEHLLDIVTSVRRDATPSVALAMARRKEFEGRMLAILDPELRHSSPSRKQSAALIGSLALISIVVGAAAPSPRAHPEHALNPVNTAQGIDLLNSRQSDTKGYPDSREIIGGSKMHEKTETVMSQNTQTVMSQNTITSMHTSQGEQNLAKVVEQALKLGTSAASNALIQLAQGGSKAAGKDTDERPTLLARILATDTSASLRRIAAWGLAEYADNQIAAEALAKALGHDSDPTVREMAAWALAEGNHRSVAVDALSAAVRGDANTEVRATAVWALGSVGDRSSADALSAALSDASPEVRKRAAWALGNSDLKQAPPKLISMLNDKDPEVRELVAWALYQIEDPASIPALEAALARESDKEMQINYIRALAAVGEKSVDALKGLLESKDPEIRSIAVRALAGGHATGPWPYPWPEPRPFPN